MSASGPGPALFARYPELAGRIPWRPLGDFPTPVERLEGLLPPAVELWVKRDDRSAPLYGGNKVRKLEFLLAEALARGATSVSTLGAYGSHHVLATAFYARQAGLAPRAVVFPQPVTPHVLETLLGDAALGVEFSVAGSLLGVPPRVLGERLRRGCHYLPPGGSSATGTLGYVTAAFELADQIERGECPRPDRIYVALGSRGTAAGLEVGLALAGLPTEVIAVRVVAAAITSRRSTLGLARRTEILIDPRLGMRGRRAEPRLRVDGRFLGPGYGHPTAAAKRAIEVAAGAGLHLEATYTGKAVAALLTDGEAGLLDGRKVLFWNTFSSVDLRHLLDRSPGPMALPPRLRRLFPDPG